MNDSLIGKPELANYVPADHVYLVAGEFDKLQAVLGIRPPTVAYYKAHGSPLELARLGYVEILPPFPGARTLVRGYAPHSYM